MICPDRGRSRLDNPLLGHIELRRWADGIRTEIHALYLAVRDPRTPWYAKFLGVCIVAYAISPIDLIPDFIPALGYLDDLLIIPAGLWIVRLMIPHQVLAEARQRARQVQIKGKWIGLVIILVVWIAAVALVGLIVWKIFDPSTTSAPAGHEVVR